MRRSNGGVRQGGARSPCTRRLSFSNLALILPQANIEYASRPYHPRLKMAEEEVSQPQSIQARIASLNLGQVGRGPVDSALPKVSPRPPPPKPPTQRSLSTVSPTATSRSNGIGNEPSGSDPRSLPAIATAEPTKPAPPPRLPPRRPSTQQSQPSPALPPRRPSEQLSRRDSQESISSVVSSASALSNGTTRSKLSNVPSRDSSRMLAPVYDPASLPALPAKKPAQEKEKTSDRVPLKSTYSSSSIKTVDLVPPPKTPTIPRRPSPRQRAAETFKPPPTPNLPRRPTAPEPIAEQPVQSAARKLPPTIVPPVRPRSEDPVPTIEKTQADNAPPAVPLSTRPDLSKIMATRPKPAATTSTANERQPSPATSCLKCRDFSAVDAHAANFPRQNVPSLDWLATQLTTPFPSATDKARAIFTWLHHNIDYNVDAYFSGNLQRSTPASTLNSGLAVCEGYAGLFAAIATKAGLEAIVVGGHGKGTFPMRLTHPRHPLPWPSSHQPFIRC